VVVFVQEAEHARNKIAGAINKMCLRIIAGFSVWFN